MFPCKPKAYTGTRNKPCPSFPQSVERESRAFSQGTGFRLEPVPAGSKQGTCRNDNFEGIFGSMTRKIIYRSVKDRTLESGAFCGDIITEKDSIDTLRRDKYDYRQSGK